jgi:hypothetical protein
MDVISGLLQTCIRYRIYGERSEELPILMANVP